MKHSEEESNLIKQRLMSLDVFRGFSMFWSMGGSAIIITAASLSAWEWDDVLSEQMHHVDWIGLHFSDLIFPFIMFVSGVSTLLAINSKLEKGVSRKSLALVILRRVVILVLLGIVYNILHSHSFSNLRFASVLGQIGLAYGIAAGIVLFSRKPFTPLLWSIGILTTYAIVQLFVPVPEYGAGILTEEGVINGYIDRLLLPGQLYGGVYDPEGLLGIISASAIVLLGVQAGFVLRTEYFVDGYRKTAILAVSGLFLILLGVLISPFYPLIKSVWTSTFTLVAGGISMMLLALFYLVIDVWKFQRWAYFFRIIGLNSITIYFVVQIIDFRYMSNFLFLGVSGLFGLFQPVIFIISIIALKWLFLWFLYRKKIFLKV